MINLKINKPTKNNQKEKKLLSLILSKKKQM